MILRNVVRRIRAAAILLNQAKRPGLSNVEKSSYLRSAIILLSSVVEGLVYELVKKHTAPNHIVYQKKEHLLKHKIPKTIFATSGDLLLCEKINKDVLIHDDGVTFGKLNLYLKDNHIVTPTQYKALNNVRIERNKVHLQGLAEPDTGYTRAKVEKISKALTFLIKLI